MQAPNFSKLVLSSPTWPEPLTLSDAGVSAGAKSWIQVARTGNFVSSRYGKFSITREDLATMLHNYANVTPKAPTKLPVDYDHLSMAPKKPGDGVAAGWMRKLELRSNGDELWAEVEWTPTAAERIRAREYQFVSPSFVKDYTYKDGTKIGPTLLAAAITNHPFLEGMEAVTLASDQTRERLLELSAGILELATPEEETVVHLMEVGQQVAIQEAFLRDPSQAGATYEIVEVVGSGDDAFVALKDANGVVLQWFRATELEPAPAPAAAPPAPVPGVPPVAAADNPPAAAGAPAAPPADNGGTGGVRYGRRSTDEVRSMSMSDVFTLRDTKGNEVEIAKDALEAVFKPAPAVPEGHVVVEKASLETMQASLAASQEQVTSLSAQVEDLATTAATERRNSQLAQVESRLSTLSRGAFITKAERDWAKKMFGGEAVNLSALEEWASTKTTPLVNLNQERGSGHDTPAPKEAAVNLMSLADQIVAEGRQRGEVVQLRDAVKEAARRNYTMAEQYREEYAPVE